MEATCVKSDIKIGIIGLGSMGQRRVRDLQKLGCKIFGYDVRNDRINDVEKNFGVHPCFSIDDMFKAGLNALVISTPPDSHFYYYQMAFENKIPFFSEASIFTPNAEWFREMEESTGIKSYPSGTWLFHPIFQKLKELIDREAHVNSVHYHYAGYLPYWHPWESYKDFYAGQKLTSAAREMVVFEMEALVWIFGKVKSVCSINNQAGKWETDMDDQYYILLEFENGIKGTLTIELHQTDAFRKAVVSCLNKSFKFDGSLHEIREFDFESKTYKFHKPPSLRSLSSFNFEDIYFEEIKSFLQAVISGANFPKTWEEDRHLSDILYACERSAESRSWVKIDDIRNSYFGNKL